MSINLTSTDVGKLITDIVGTWRSMIETNGVALTCFIDPKIDGEYMIDTQSFHACLNTLVSNAAHYTDTGRVHVHVTAEDKPQIQLTNLSIIVADTGRGIANQKQLSFMRGNDRTRLSEAMKTAQELGGKITFNSALGRGSEFRFNAPCKVSDILELETEQSLDVIPSNADELIDIDINYEDIPIHAPAKIIQPAPDRSDKARFDPDNLRGLRVLIVDDVASNQDVVKLFLKPEGCQCICSMAGEEALETLKTQMVDVILMDIRMPGMSGIETTQAIRNSDLAVKNVPIIALTADSSAATNAACMAAGADLFLTKPVLCRDLLESIRFVRRYQDHEEPSQSQVA